MDCFKYFLPQRIVILIGVNIAVAVFVVIVVNLDFRLCQGIK
jgi:hypothetical protein